MKKYVFFLNRNILKMVNDCEINLQNCKLIDVLYKMITPSYKCLLTFHNMTPSKHEICGRMACSLFIQNFRATDGFVSLGRMCSMEVSYH